MAKVNGKHDPTVNFSLAKTKSKLSGTFAAKKHMLLSISRT